LTDPTASPALRAARRRAVRLALERLEPGLRIVAEDVLAFATRIDLVGVDALRRPVAVSLAEPGREDAHLATALAHRHWLASHLADWLKIAPELGCDATAPVRSLLVAPSFGDETRGAVAGLPPGWVELLRAVEPLRGDDRPGWLERVVTRPAVGADGRHPAGSDGGGPVFRSGLTQHDLALSDAETALFE
jgi:hypothetical protein